MLKTALNVVQDMRKRIRTAHGEEVSRLCDCEDCSLAKELDLLLANERFCAFLGTITMHRDFAEDFRAQA